MTAAKQGLPANVDAERFVLGSILLDDEAFAHALADLKPEDFALEAHRRILRRAADLYGREERINRVTLYEELARHGEAESVGGLSYLVELDDGLPLVPSLDSYIRILHEKSALRKVLFACDNLSRRVELGDPSAEISKAAEDLFAGIGARGQGYRSPTEIPSVRDCAGGEVTYVRDPELARASVTAVTGEAGAGKSTVATVCARDAARSGTPVLILDRENPLSVIVDRLERLGAADERAIKIWGGWLPEPAPLPDAPVVVDWVKLSEPKPLVIVDSLSGFFDGDQNDASEMRGFLHRCRRLANLGASVLVLHHSGKSESARDYRGSSDFSASVDQAFHCTSFGDGGRLDKIVLRPYKSRFGFAGELIYEYADGRFVRGDAAEVRQTVNEQLTVLLRLNPGVTAGKFDDLANARGLGRNRARGFLADGLLAGYVRRETGAKNVKRHFLVEQNGLG